MTVSTDELLDAASRLHGYLLRECWNGCALAGPDSGVRFNARIGRFVKSYLDFIPWSDDYIYMQAQGYWILDNWLMADLLDERYSQLALDCTRHVLSSQQPDGYWDYPNPEWKGRIATVEGCFAALGLLESYGRVQHEPFLAGARRWHRYLASAVGFQGADGLLAVNYFSNVAGGMVPNNTTLVLQTLARLAEVTHDDRFLAPCGGMVAWLNHVQLDSGELPYAVDSSNGSGRAHFLCYQYNAFEFLDLVDYYRITGDEAVRPVLERLAAYLSTGLAASGAARYDCFHETPEVTYYTAALAQALSQATMLGMGDFRSLAERSYRRVLSQQRADGGFKFFSRANYGFLSDRRAYPRNLSMILHHLLVEAQTQASPLEHGRVGEREQQAMRILLVTNRYPTDETPGSSPCIGHQRRDIQRLGHDVDVLLVSGARGALKYLKAMGRVFWASQVKRQYDLIHAHYGYCGVVARMQFRCPVVVTFRGSDVLSRLERPLSRWVARWVDRTIVMTEEMRRLLGRDDTHVIPYGIDLDLFQPRAQAEVRRELGLPLEIPLVLFPYDPERPEKRFDLVEQAVAILGDEFPDLQVLAIYGQPHESVASYMNACDTMVLASDHEGAPVAIREAMACNLPIVSVDVGDVADVIRDTEGCYICRRSPDDIAAKLAKVLRARERTDGRRAVSRLSTSQAAIDVAAIYKELVAGAPEARFARRTGQRAAA